MTRLAQLAVIGALLAAAGTAVGEAPDARVVVSDGGLVYDREYPFIHYSDTPVHNDIARLQKRLADGTVKLTRSPQHGYL
ncbi:MAG TPA: hypothetical protein VMU34_20270, partial [Mycobacterium sp.]|nr:hypothetical protein [Mycobacterium sp.]